MQKEDQLEIILSTPLVIGSLSALLDMLIKDVDKGGKVSTKYYKNRVEELRESYPNLLPSKEVTINQ
jgi:hypothetical protein